MFHTGSNRRSLVLLAGIASFVLSGCGSTPAPTETKPRETTRAPQVQPVTVLASEQALAYAKKAWEHRGDKLQRDTYLLDAAQAFIDERTPNLAKQVLAEVMPSTLPNALTAKRNLLIATLYFDKNSDATPLLALLNDAQYVPASLQKDYANILYSLYQNQGENLRATDYLLQSDAPADEKAKQAWMIVSGLANDTLDGVSAQYPSLAPYIALRQLATQHAFDAAALRDALNQFNTVYRNHPVTRFMPQEINEAAQLTPPNIDDVAVLLPLTGRLGATGLAVKDGILAAYYFQMASAPSPAALPQLRFVDTNEKSDEELLAEVGEAKFIIGPLLKENIKRLSDKLPFGVNMLALNRIEASPIVPAVATTEAISTTTVNGSAKSFFALAPEDEANQLAKLIYNKGLRAPVVISRDSGLYTRMQNAFSKRWVELNPPGKANLTHVNYTNSATLREGITRALDVEQSNERINQIEYMVNEEVYNMPRSRHDIDAIVVFASPQDTELLNPIVEASLTPYEDKVVNVYVTSRSMDYNSGKNQWRDLQNVHFIDMPWVLPNNQWQLLSEQAAAAWPERSTLHERLFAFGVDAYLLLPQIGVLDTLPFVTFKGLTGTLSVNPQHEVERLLPQGYISREQIYTIEQ